MSYEELITHKADLRGVDDLHVAVLVLTLDLLRCGVDMRVVVTQLQEPLDTSTRVLWALTIEAMRQAHDKTSALQPLPLSRGDELVDDALRVVRKVTELRLPDSKCAG